MKKLNREKLAEPLFFFAYVVFMVATVLQTTMYTEMPYIPQLFIAMRYFAFVVAAFKVLLDLYGDLTRVNGEREKLLDWVSVVIKYVLMSALVVAVSITADERSLAFLLVILLAARGVQVNKIFRVTLWMQAFLAAFVFLSAAVGFIIDLRFERGGVFNRHALGYWFPSYIMSYYFFVLLLLFWTRKKPLKPTSVALLEGLNLLLYLLTDARLGLMVNTFLIAVEFVRSVEKWRAPLHRFVDRLMGVPVLGPVIRWGWALLPELLCGYIALLFTFPLSGLAQKTDYILSNRIYYAYVGVRPDRYLRHRKDLRLCRLRVRVHPSVLRRARVPRHACRHVLGQRAAGPERGVPQVLPLRHHLHLLLRRAAAPRAEHEHVPVPDRPAADAAVLPAAAHREAEKRKTGGARNRSDRNRRSGVTKNQKASRSGSLFHLFEEKY